MITRLLCRPTKKKHNVITALNSAADLVSSLLESQYSMLTELKLSAREYFLKMVPLKLISDISTASTSLNTQEA